jgi:hypothetical protein
LAFSFQSVAQENSVQQKDSVTVKTKKERKKERREKRKQKRLTANYQYDALSPSKAAFYSALVPGMGQIYNKKYWKAPIVWAAMATSTSIYLFNNSEYKRYRRAFRQREAGLQDEFTLDSGIEVISRDGLISAQRTLRNNRDLSILSTVIIYVLQIVEASVNAHLLQFNTNENLSIKPIVVPDPLQIEAPTFGLRLKYSFK